MNNQSPLSKSEHDELYKDLLDDDRNKKSNKKFAIFLSILILFFSLYLISIGFRQTSVETEKKTIQISLPKPTNTIHFDNPTIIVQTPIPTDWKGRKIATTLEVPELYPNTVWEESDYDPSRDDLNMVGDYANEYSRVEFMKGKTWHSKLGFSNRNNDLLYYYHEALVANGWIAGGDTDYLPVGQMELMPMVADGPCESIAPYLGIKDGYLRLVTLHSQVIPCLSDDPQDGINVNPKMFYTIYVSEPTRIEDLIRH